MNIFVGDFHFQVHFCHALYRLGGEQYLLPLARLTGYKYLEVNFLLAKWDKHDQFLLLFCDAGVAWLRGM